MQKYGFLSTLFYEKISIEDVKTKYKVSYFIEISFTLLMETGKLFKNYPHPTPAAIKLNTIFHELLQNVAVHPTTQSCFFSLLSSL